MASPSRPRKPAPGLTLSWDGRLVGKAPRLPGAPGLPPVITITFRPCILGGKSPPAITGLQADFLPRGICLDLLKLRRSGDECIATYRVQSRRS